MPALSPPQPHGVYQEPSVFQKLKIGAIMGGSVGLCIGLIFGTASILKYGAGPKGYLGTMGQYIGSSAASFAFFMAIGAVIRTEEASALTAHDRLHMQALRQNSPISLALIKHMSRSKVVL